MFQMCWSWEIRAMRYINCGSRDGFLQKVLEYRCGTGGYCTRSAQVIPRHQGQVEAVNQNDTADGDATSICCKRHPRYIRKCHAELATATADTSTTSCPCWPGSIWDVERCREDVLWQEILGW